MRQATTAEYPGIVNVRELWLSDSTRQDRLYQCPTLFSATVLDAKSWSFQRPQMIRVQQNESSSLLGKALEMTQMYLRRQMCRLGLQCMMQKWLKSWVSRCLALQRQALKLSRCLALQRQALKMRRCLALQRQAPKMCVPSCPRPTPCRPTRSRPRPTP